MTVAGDDDDSFFFVDLVVVVVVAMKTLTKERTPPTQILKKRTGEDADWAVFFTIESMVINHVSP